MARSSKFTFEEKLNAINNILFNYSSINYEAKKLNANRETISTWIINYKSYGINGLISTPRNSLYSMKLKVSAVKEYLLGNISLSKICKKYKIKSKSVLRKWISLYNNISLKSRGSGSVRIKGVRKNLTLEDRVEVVKHYLEISKDYSETAIDFQVSYQQVYQWVQKYNKYGIDGLIDRRGKRKTEEELTEVEKLKLENKLLKAEKRRIELENAFLKKLNELEGV